MTDGLLAHSSPSPDREPHLYGDHVRGAVLGARTNAEAVAAYMPEGRRAKFVSTVVDGTTFHDLGKLDPENQTGLRQGRSGKMPWDHVDAGVAHLLRAGAKPAAWIARAHHAPGLPAYAEEFNPVDPGAARGLRGGRVGERDSDAGDTLRARVDSTLDDLVVAHAKAAGEHVAAKGGEKHHLWLRLALSCLVDGDHADAAWYECGRRPPDPPRPRWDERLAALDGYVAGLPKGGPRQADRRAFYDACRNGSAESAMVACEGPVGIGKTTAVTAWCIRRAIASGARRIFVVAPYTTILTQTAKALRAALVLPDEADRADEIVAEHHHRADFQALASRELAVLWRAPIVVTTSVQFFETLAACEPSRLRKLHGLPGSIVFIDEAHAALPAPLWRQNWAWIRELSADWGCSFVFASGSLARVWSDAEVVGEGAAMTLPDVVPPQLAAKLDGAEHTRVRYRTLGRIADPISTLTDTPGPRLAVFNTVRTAAVIAARLRAAGANVLHLSTALCPCDRDRILDEVRRRLAVGSGYPPDWTLIATSLVEAGVDLSFRTALRERFSTASLIQIGGRANRHGAALEPGDVLDFQLDHDEDTTSHPDATTASEVLREFFEQGRLCGVVNAATLVTAALRAELRSRHGQTGLELENAERACDYPEVARLGRLIADDTVLVVVDRVLEEKLTKRQPVSARDLLAASVQIRRSKVDEYALKELPGRPGVYVWRQAYDGMFLGYMAGVMALDRAESWVL